MFNANPCYVAEISGNHNGKFSDIVAHMMAATEAGAHAVKLQVYNPSELVHKNAMHTVQDGLWAGKDLWSLYAENMITPQIVRDVFKFAQDNSINLFATVYGFESLELLERIGCRAYKIASFENNDHMFIQQVLSLQKPTVISLGGLLSLERDKLIYDVDSDYAGPDQEVIFLHCVSRYPCELSELNLHVLQQFNNTHTMRYGFSDHTIGTKAAEYAVVSGAQMIEKHFTLRSGGVDAAFSATPHSFKKLVENCNIAATTRSIQRMTNEEWAMQYKRSIWVIEDVKKGGKLTNKNINILRPREGIEPDMWGELIGKTAKTDIKAGTPLTKDLIVETLSRKSR